VNVSNGASKPFKCERTGVKVNEELEKTLCGVKLWNTFRDKPNQGT
jgi:hypothetical protein